MCYFTIPSEIEEKVFKIVRITSCRYLTFMSKYDPPKIPISPSHFE